ncbi:MAG: tRNA (adenine-N1)-methyltransferase [Candidatus Altiarchaeota archaeon]
MKMKLLIDEKGSTYLVRGVSDFHTKYGFLREADIKKAKPGGRLVSNTGQSFTVLNPSFVDLLSKIKRGPQTMQLKDVALVAAYTGVGPGSKVVDSGTGSGIQAFYLAHLAAPGKVVSYELREDFHELASKNLERIGLKNLTLKKADVYAGIKEKNVDVAALDLPEPWLVVPHLKKSLKVGGYVSSYSPSITQSKRFVDALGVDFTHETFETLLRDWKMDTVRPHTRMLGHTGFLTIARWLG